jgi:zinc and cadmium transporter
MELLAWIILFAVLGSVLGVLGASSLLLLPEKLVLRLLPSLVSFAIGALLGAAFLGLLPHAIADGRLLGAHRILGVALLGILVFFLLEKMLLWRHCHIDECEAHGPDHHDHARKSVSGALILMGDGIHNFVDGVLIAAAFLTDVHLGIVTSLAVIAHEIPQELGDVAILLHAGLSRARTLAYNLLSSLTTIVGGVAAYFSLSTAERFVPYVLALAAASFIYIAMSDLIPGLHKRTEAAATVHQMLLILAGIGVIFAVHSTLH